MKNYLKALLIALIGWEIFKVIFVGLNLLVEVIPFVEPVMWAIFFIGGAISIITLFVLDEREV